MEAAWNGWRCGTTSEDSVITQRSCIGYILDWCRESGIDDPKELTRPITERYQRWLYQNCRLRSKAVVCRGERFAVMTSVLSCSLACPSISWPRSSRVRAIHFESGYPDDTIPFAPLPHRCHRCRDSAGDFTVVAFPL